MLLLKIIPIWTNDNADLSHTIVELVQDQSKAMLVWVRHVKNMKWQNDKMTLWLAYTSALVILSSIQVASLSLTEQWLVLNNVIYIHSYQ